MTIREKIRLAFAVFLVSVFGITLNGLDLTPAEEVPVAGIALNALDLVPVPEVEVAVAGLTFNILD